MLNTSSSSSASPSVFFLLPPLILLYHSFTVHWNCTLALTLTFLSPLFPPDMLQLLFQWSLQFFFSHSRLYEEAIPVALAVSLLPSSCHTAFTRLPEFITELQEDQHILKWPVPLPGSGFRPDLLLKILSRKPSWCIWYLSCYGYDMLVIDEERFSQNNSHNIKKYFPRKHY